MKNVTWRVDVGCSGPGKAGPIRTLSGSNRSKECGADHPATISISRWCHCSPVELDATRVARPVRGRLSRVIPSVQSSVRTDIVRRRRCSGRSNP